jgi:hypothetical protein
MILEKVAYNSVVRDHYNKAVEIGTLLDDNKTPEEIAGIIAGDRVLLGSILLLAANHMKKTGDRPHAENE